MKTRFLLVAITALICSAHYAMAQAPSGSTGQCKDGSYTSAASKSGACSGHKGVQTWFAASGAPTAASAAAAPTPTPAQTTKPTPTPASAAASPMPTATKTAAAGGGPGMVWVNLPTKIYHCPGTQYYGKTKNGKYMSESDAGAMGARADHNKPCSK